MDNDLTMSQAKKHSLLRSFSFAFSGIFRIIKTERNIQIHLLAALIVIVLGLIVDLSRMEWLLVVLIIFVILAAEAFNSVIEEICNLLREKLNLAYEETKLARDISAGAVLLLAIASIIIGLSIFIPYLLSL